METEDQLEELQRNYDPGVILDNTSEPSSPDLITDTETENEECDTEECNNNNEELYERISVLRTTIQTLKEQLQEERENFQRELQASRESDYINRTTKLGIDYYNDYERYHDLIVQAHYHNRQNIQKQIAVANYKRRLMEVENMCSLELMKVKQSVQILQPLQVMVNEWKFESEAGDYNKGRGDVREKKEAGDMPEVQMPLEGLSHVDNVKGREEIGVSVSDPGLGDSECWVQKQSQSDSNIPEINVDAEM